MAIDPSCYSQDPRDHCPLYFTSWAGDPPSALLICPPLTLSWDFSLACRAGRTSPPTPPPQLDAVPSAEHPGDPGATPWGRDGQGGRCKGAGAGEAKRVGHDHRGAGRAPAAAAGGGGASRAASGCPTRRDVCARSRSRGSPLSRAARPGHRDWPAASPGSR